MASGISGTMRQVGVALGFAGLGAVLAHRTADAFAAKTYPLDIASDLIPSLTRLVVEGDIAGATASLAPSIQPAFRLAANASMFEGFHLILLIAGIVGVVGAVLTYVLVRPSTAAPYP